MSSPEPALLSSSARSGERLRSLDQFRGYTVARMLLVNFLGSFAVCPRVLRHSHDYVSYADTIMPQFLFAVGFAMRLTFVRRVQNYGIWNSCGRMARRLLGLVLLSLVIYDVSPRAESWEQLTSQSLWEILQEPLKRNWFQTLMHIAVTSLWILPVTASRGAVRISWMVGSALAHVVLSESFNFEWVNTSPNGIDGGPLGFLTWTTPAIVGTLACDVLAGNGPRPILRPLLAASLLMGAGYLLSCGTRLYDVSPSAQTGDTLEKLASDPVIPSQERVDRHMTRKGWTEMLAEAPFVPPPDAKRRQWNYWMMSQRAGTLSYLVFSSGFALAAYLVFVGACDRLSLEVPLFRTFGTNALAAYVVHELVGSAVKPFIPKDSPGWYVGIGVAVFFAITWTIVRHFEKRGMYLRV